MREALASRIAALKSFVGLAAGAYRACLAEGDFYLLARQLTPQARERDQRFVCGQGVPCRGGREGLPHAFRSCTGLLLSPPPAASLTLATAVGPRGWAIAHPGYFRMRHSYRALGAGEIS